MFGVSTPQLLLFVLVLLLLFGSARLPSLMRNLGRSANEFKRGMQDDPDDGQKLEDGSKG
jgi:sec-independent protein translocase protein TatA